MQSCTVLKLRLVPGSILEGDLAIHFINVWWEHYGMFGRYAPLEEHLLTLPILNMYLFRLLLHKPRRRNATYQRNDDVVRTSYKKFVSSYHGQHFFSDHIEFATYALTHYHDHFHDSLILAWSSNHSLKYTLNRLLHRYKQSSILFWF